MIKTATKRPASKLTLGPLYFHWPAEIRRDFYYKIADEAPVDCVYLGEVVCSKRESYFAPYFDEIRERLISSGKQVILSTLSLVTSAREKEAIEHRAQSGALIEANDVACVQLLAGKPHIIGPFINVFNEGTRDFMVSNGAIRIVIPVEAPARTIKVLAKRRGVDTEVQVFGKQPLSVAMRCYHARSRGLTKDSCQFVCGLDSDGLPADTLDKQKLLTINGTQTMSRGYGVLLNELQDMQKMGVSHFRISPHDMNMVHVAEIFRSVLDKKRTGEEALHQLKVVTGDVPYINGFHHAREGMSWIDKKAS